MKSTFYLYNNVSLVSGVVYTIIQTQKCVDIGRVIVLLPLLLDDRTVDKICTNKSKFANLISLNRRFLANYNDRYKSILPLVFDALSFLLELKTISIDKGMIINLKNELLDDMIVDCGSDRLKKIAFAAEYLFTDTKNIDLKNLYNTFNIEL